MTVRNGDRDISSSDSERTIPLMSLLIPLLLVVVCGLVAWQFAPTVNKGISGDTTLFALVAMLAVGIERIMEFGWTLVDHSKALGDMWPTGCLKQALETVERETRQLVGQHLDNAKTALVDAKAAASAGDTRLGAFQKHIRDIDGLQSQLTDSLNRALNLAPGNARLALLRGIATQATEAIGAANAAIGATAQNLQTAVTVASGLIDGAASFVDSFIDNPGRRLISILAGVCCGLLLAGFIGLDMFTPVLPAALAGSKLGVLLTGATIGLGPAPVHEVIKALQTMKAVKRPDPV